jgi:hypothetical protein
MSLIKLASITLPVETQTYIRSDIDSGLTLKFNESGTTIFALESGLTIYALESGITGFALESGLTAYFKESGTTIFALESGLTAYSFESGLTLKFNESGITSYALESGLTLYELKTDLNTELENYLHLSGGTITGTLKISGTTSAINTYISGYTYQYNPTGNFHTEAGKVIFAQTGDSASFQLLSNVSCGVIMKKDSGTATGLTANTLLGAIQSFASDGTGLFQIGAIQWQCAENQTPTNRGSNLQLFATKTGSTSATKGIEILGGFGNAVQFNNQYRFPILSGTTNDILVNTSAGVLNWTSLNNYALQSGLTGYELSANLDTDVGALGYVKDGGLENYLHLTGGTMTGPIEIQTSGLGDTTNCIILTDIGDAVTRYKVYISGGTWCFDSI